MSVLLASSAARLVASAPSDFRKPAKRASTFRSWFFTASHRAWYTSQNRLSSSCSSASSERTSCSFTCFIVVRSFFSFIRASTKGLSSLSPSCAKKTAISCTRRPRVFRSFGGLSRRPRNRARPCSMTPTSCMAASIARCCFFWFSESCRFCSCCASSNAFSAECSCSLARRSVPAASRSFSTSASSSFCAFSIFFRSSKYGRNSASIRRMNAVWVSASASAIMSSVFSSTSVRRGLRNTSNTKDAIICPTASSSCPSTTSLITWSRLATGGGNGHLVRRSWGASVLYVLQCLTAPKSSGRSFMFKFTSPKSWPSSSSGSGADSPRLFPRACRLSFISTRSVRPFVAVGCCFSVDRWLDLLASCFPPTL
mmetsp:Transcript_4897/g.12173  ORF Transcript_4897/g.12173 Transcript_4897/m.12173 type:complete len:369 (+) Transcript_4897:1297-2403(+)